MRKDHDKYAIVIADKEYDYAMVFSFAQDKLWEWLHAEEQFTESDLDIPIPGREATTSITVGSPIDDKAHALIAESPGEGLLHPWVHESEFFDSEHGGESEALKWANEHFGDDCVFSTFEY